MNIRFEFLTVFRRKIGLESLIVELPDRVGGSGAEAIPTVVEALQALQNRMADKRLKLLDRDQLAGGLLVFFKTSAGGLVRIFDPEVRRVAPGQTLVLSVAMEGG